ncbi:MAG: CPBP family intramembrane metalloprotease [Phycisphaerales bacterium]|nr:CPBP family intramembrane metalloprotease [Phycisphaerales bacterium]
MSKSQRSVLGAWAVIISCIALYLCLDFILPSGEAPEDAQEQAIEEVAGQEADAAEAGSMVGFKETLQGKMVSAVLAGGPAQMMTEIAIQQIEPMLDVGQGPVTNLCAAILLARAGENSKASTEMDAVIVRVEADPKSAPPAFLKCARIVQMLIRQKADASAATAISSEDAEFLKANLNWYGELMISTVSFDPTFEGNLEKSQLLLVVSFFTFGFIVLIAGLGGFVWLVILAVKWAGGRLALPLAEPIHTALTLPWIFAGWFALTLLLSIAIALISTRAGRLSGGLPLFLQLASMVLPLAALMIGRWWGVSWKQVCHDVGLHCGRGFWREFCYGFTVWATAIPMLIAGAIIAFVLSLLLSKELSDAGHPLPEAIAQATWGTRIVLLFLAVVAAPIVEEIVFRGVLFRHLRDISQKWGRGLSFVAAALGSSFVFAAIHPQGILFIPILGALAFAFCLARETRGSLISCMVAHGFHNGLVTLLVIALSS